MMLIIAGLLMATHYRCAIMSICINCSVVSEEGDSGATDWDVD